MMDFGGEHLGTGCTRGILSEYQECCTPLTMSCRDHRLLGMWTQKQTPSTPLQSMTVCYLSISLASTIQKIMCARSNNYCKIVTIVQMYIFKWSFPSHCHRCCLNYVLILTVHCSWASRNDLARKLTYQQTQWCLAIALGHIVSQAW